jgi:hypothetical protein
VIDVYLCLEKKAKKGKALGFFRLSLKVLLHSIFYKILLWKKMDLLEDGATNEKLQEDDREAEASLSVFKSRSEIEKERTNNLV